MKKTLWIIILLAFIVGAVLMAVGFSAGATMGLYINETGVHVSDRKVKPIEITEDMQEFTKINVDVDAARVRVVKSDKRGMEMTYRWGEPAYSVENGVLKITHKADRRIKFELFNFFSDDNEITIFYKSETPLEEVDIRSGFGDVSLENVEAESVNLYISCGRLAAKGVKAGDFICRNSLGDIIINDAEVSGLTEIKVSLGSIDMRGDFGDTIIENSLGDTVFYSKNKIDAYKYDLKVSLGNLIVNGSRHGDGSGSVYQGGNGSKSLKISASSGSVNVNFSDNPQEETQ